MKRLITAALVATAMGLTLCGCEDKSSPSGTQTTADKVMDTAKDEAQKAADATKEAAAKAADATKEAASKAAAEMKQAASDAAAKTQQAASDLKDKAAGATTPAPTTAPSTAPPPAPASGAADVPATATTAMKDYLSSLTGITQKASAISSPADGAVAMPDLKSLTSKLQDSWSKLDSLAPGTKDKLKGMFADQLKPATQAFEAQVQRISDMPGLSSVSDMLKSVKLFK